jgi:hypothetical protein
MLGWELVVQLSCVDGWVLKPTLCWARHKCYNWKIPYNIESQEKVKVGGCKAVAKENVQQRR